MEWDQEERKQTPTNQRQLQQTPLEEEYQLSAQLVGHDYGVRIRQLQSDQQIDSECFFAQILTRLSAP